MKKIVQIVSFLALFCWAIPLQAQDPGKADKLFTDGNYSAAIQLYRQLYHRHPGSALYSYRLGRCEQALGMYEEAVVHLTESGTRYSLRALWLARAAFPTYRFELAKTMYEEWLHSADTTHHQYKKAQVELARTEQMLRYMNRVENIVYLDTISFPSATLPKHLPSISPDMGKIEIRDGRFISTNQRGDRRYIAFTCKKTGRRLIGKQERLLDEWSSIDTLPEMINQFKEQDFPILMPDGVTLYFCAKDTTDGMGGWDIYMTKYNPATNTYLMPELLGMPFNSMADDKLFLYDESAGKGFFITNRTNPNRLMLCSFQYSKPKYLRDSSENYMREYVQLRTIPRLYGHSSSASHTADIVETNKWEAFEEEKPEWTLILNDSTTYTSFADFRSTEAKEAMQTYLDLLLEIDEANEQLAQYRVAFQEAPADERTLLKDLILQLELDVRRLFNEAEKVRKEAIRKETEWANAEIK